MKFYWRLQLEIDHVVADEYYERTNRGQRNFLEPETRTTRSTVWRLGGNLNGQKGSETTYKDDEVISSKGWNENGKPE